MAEKVKLTPTLLSEIEREARVFIRKIGDLQERLNGKDLRYPCKERAALKRAALDLKNELTKITQSIVY